MISIVVLYAVGAINFLIALDGFITAYHDTGKRTVLDNGFGLDV